MRHTLGHPSQVKPPPRSIETLHKLRSYTAAVIPSYTEMEINEGGHRYANTLIT